jgi:hypothetical protein
MKNVINFGLLVILICPSILLACKNGEPSIDTPYKAGQIIADHTVVDKFDDIPQYYIDKVKEMWVSVPGESHSAGYRNGMALLEAADSKFSVSIVESGTPEPYTTTALRFSRGTWGSYWYTTGWQYIYSEGDWWVSSIGIQRTKDGLDYCNTSGPALAAIGFGWCYDDTGNGGPTVGYDPVYGCRWWGSSAFNPNGDKPWGLDDADNAITGNTVNLDTYLAATQGYIDYCKSKGYDTKVFFTTPPVDTYFTGEMGYQGSLKHERIRDYVKGDTTRILFDYADILCYDDDGKQTTSAWNEHTYGTITVINGASPTVGHISSAGATRIAKAMWWMLARMAGWDGK